jgi:hypothetical protein
MSSESPAAKLDGTLLSRRDDGYEAAREDAIWNGHKPDRFPDLILLAESAEDVVEGVRLAKREGHRIGIRAGGHSFTATGVRDGGLLIDVSRLTDVEVDASTNTAWIGPGIIAQDLEKHLTKEGLTFPYGGCGTVGMGGYMLSGGYGLNGRSYGAAGSNIRALDVVTSEGELIRADSTQNTDYLWAARGGGYGYFGAIVRFQIDLYPAPKLITETTLTYTLDHFNDLLAWYLGALDQADPSLMLLAFGHKDHEGITPDGGSVVTILAITFTDTKEEADQILEPVLTAPVLESAVFKEIGTPTTLDEIWADVDPLYPKGARFLSDTFWVKDPQAEGFIEALESPYKTLPSPGSHVMLNPWIPRERDDEALSGTTVLPVHVYAVFEDAAEEGRMRTWIQEQIEPMLPYSNGVGKVNESDLLVRDQNHLGDAHLQKLNELRAKYDPEHRFHDLLRKNG